MNELQIAATENQTYKKPIRPESNIFEESLEPVDSKNRQEGENKMVGDDENDGTAYYDIDIFASHIKDV